MSTLSPASFFNDKQRYYIPAGKMIRFHPPPTKSYKIITTADSVRVKGTLVELQPQSSSEDACTWDTYPNQPLYMARYENPRVAKASRTVYWEVELPEYIYSEDKKEAQVCMGFVVKDSARLEAMQAAGAGGVDPRVHLSPYDNKIAVGPSLLINTSTGEAYADGVEIPIEYPLKPGVSTVGMGITFAFDPTSVEQPADDSEKKEKGLFKKWVDKHTHAPPVASATPEELQPVPVAVFLSVDGEMVGVDVSDVNMVDLGFDGTRDVYPTVLVKGNGAQATLKMGECVEWEGEGGVDDAKIKGLGNRAKPGFKPPTWPFKANNVYGLWPMQ